MPWERCRIGYKFGRPCFHHSWFGNAPNLLAKLINYSSWHSAETIIADRLGGNDLSAIQSVAKRLNKNLVLH